MVRLKLIIDKDLIKSVGRLTGWNIVLDIAVMIFFIIISSRASIENFLRGIFNYPTDFSINWQGVINWVMTATILCIISCTSIIILSIIFGEKKKE